MQKEYRTVLRQAQEEMEEKKSRFISSVKPVSTEEEALEFLSSLKAKYWDASHNVYAYYIQGENTYQRYSDDGEPAGTAGLPVLEAIKKTGVQNLVVVVTRYYGGTNLGASGLIRAYGRSASLGIKAARIVSRQLRVEVVITLEYTLLGKIQNQLVEKEYTIKDIKYGQDVEIFVLVPVDVVDQFLKFVEEATNARALIEIGEKEYVTLDENGKLLAD